MSTPERSDPPADRPPGMPDAAPSPAPQRGPDRPIEVVLNGRSRHLAPGTTLAELVSALQGRTARTKGVAVALNQEVVPHSRWALTALSDRDRVEVLVASQGG